MYLPTKEDGAAEQGTIQGTPLFVMKEFFKKMLIFFDYVRSWKGKATLFLSVHWDITPWTFGCLFPILPSHCKHWGFSDIVIIHLLHPLHPTPPPTPSTSSTSLLSIRVIIISIKNKITSNSSTMNNNNNNTRNVLQRVGGGVEGGCTHAALLIIKAWPWLQANILWDKYQ